MKLRLYYKTLQEASPRNQESPIPKLQTSYVKTRMSIALIVRATHLCIRGSHIPTSRMSQHSQWEHGAGLSLFYHQSDNNCISNLNTSVHAEHNRRTKLHKINQQCSSIFRDPQQRHLCRPVGRSLLIYPRTPCGNLKVTPTTESNHKLPHPFLRPD